MHPAITVELAIAVFTILIAAFVGFIGQGRQPIGAVFLGLGAVLASGLVIGGTWIGLQGWGTTGGWVGLVGSIVLVALLAWPIGNMVVKGQAGRFASGLWLGYCAFCIYGYLAAGWIGLLAITLPAIAVFWITVFRLSAYVLPLRGSQRPRLTLRPIPEADRGAQALPTHPGPGTHIFPLPGLGGRLRAYVNAIRSSQWRQAFRSVLTFTMGTNYPYYFIRDGEVDVRVGGNPYSQFFAGPGLVYADPDQSGYLTTGIDVRDVLPPGLNFTGRFDLEPKPVDLRPQLCSFSVQAKTKDGIPVSVQTYVPFRIQPGNRTEERPDGELGDQAQQTQQSAKCDVGFDGSFPFRRRAVYQLAATEPVERHEEGGNGQNRYNWASDLVPLTATRIVQDIISHYDVDELCAAFDPDQLPCVEIADKMNWELRQALKPLGLEIDDGWLGNMEPQDVSVRKRRLENWKTEWERRTLQFMSEGRAERARQIEMARAQAELKILLRFSQISQASLTSDPASRAALALRFIDSLGEVVSESDSQWPMPESLKTTLRDLRGEIEEGRR